MYHMFIMKTNPLLHEIVSTCKPFRGILFYPSGNLTRPLHASSTEGNYKRWVASTAIGLSVPATALSMIISQKYPLGRCQYSCPRHLRFRQQPASQIFTKFYILYVFTYLPDEDCFWFVTGGWGICNSWIVLNQIIFHLE